MGALAFFVLPGLIIFSLGGIVGLAAPWRLRWVAMLGLALAIAFWATSVLSSTPDDSGGDEVPLLDSVIIEVVITLVGLSLFCVGGWLGRVGRKTILASRSR
jgi:hypothetical protein